MKIGEVSRLTGVTVRALHHWDAIGLLCPKNVTEAGYRVYEHEELNRLQQILFFRELGFSLEEIRGILDSPNYDRLDALKKHRSMLELKRDHIDGLIRLVDDTMKGEREMSFKEFDVSKIEAERKKYAKEVQQRWGNTKEYCQFEERTKGYNNESWNAIDAQGEEILKEFAACKNLDPSGEKAQSLVAMWQQYITSKFYDCSKPILACLGQMYVGDERFMAYLDQNGEGTAEFMAAAIIEYTSK